MDFSLFVLVNAILFIRPDELLGLGRLQTYQYVIIPCLVLSFPAVLRQLTPESLSRNPMTVCMLGLFGADILSNVANLHLEEAWAHGLDFAKMLAYYLLLVGLVTTPRRLEWLLFWLALFAAVIAALAVADYHRFIDLPSLDALKDAGNLDWRGEQETIRRMRGTGLFADPNDFCQIIALAVPVSLYYILRPDAGLQRILWLPLLALFAHAQVLTQSRGGFLAVMAGVGVLIVFRYGWRRALILGLLLLPVVLVLFAGRVTNINLKTGDTAHERIGLWSDALMMIRGSPLFGIGVGEYNKVSELVAHNSFLHAHVEMGLVGGILFVGVFFLAFWQMARLVQPPHTVVEPDLRAWHPHVIAIVAGFIISMMSLSRCYIVSTYTVVGLAAAFVNMASLQPPQPPVVVDGRLAWRLFLVDLTLLAMMYIFVRVFK